MRGEGREARDERRGKRGEGRTRISPLTTRPSSHACPVCDRRFYESDDGVVMPFCSSRCKRIDAARWLDERYGMPIEKPLEEESEHDA